jgi:CRISPR-associated protein Cas1
VRTLLIKGYGVSLRVRKGLLTVGTKDGSETVPLAEVDAVLVLTSGVSITSKAIRALAREGIQLAVLDRRGMPVAIIHHPFTTRTTTTRRAQYESTYSGKAAEVVKVVTASKLGNQAGLLRRLRRSMKVGEIAEAEEKVLKAAEEASKLRAGNLSEMRTQAMKLEAEAARVYWGAVALALPKELGFEGRDQEGADPFNTSLNYGYGVLYSRVWSAIAIAGLDPYAGFLHVDRSGNPVLVFDVVEVFRSAAVDYPLLKAFRSGIKVGLKKGLLDPESRAAVAKVVLGGLREKFSAGGQVKDLEAWIKSFALSLASYLRGEAGLNPLVFRW